MRATTIENLPPRGVRLRVDKLRAEARKRDWVTDADLARALDLDPATISRLFATDPKKRQNPGTGVIAAAKFAFPELSFEDLFEVVGPDQRQRAA